MRNLAIIIVLFFNAGLSYSQDKVKIKETFTKRYSYPDKKKNPRGKLKYIYGFHEQFDVNGNTVYRARYDSLDHQIGFDSLKYENNQLVYLNYKIFNFSGKGDVYVGMQKMEYDSLGNRISMKRWANGILESESVYTYDSNYLKCIIIETIGDKLLDSTIYITSKDHKQHNSISYSNFENGKPTVKEIGFTHFNEFNIFYLSKDIKYHKKNDFWVKFDSTYYDRKFDKNGNIIYEKSKYWEESYKYKNDKNGHWVERIEFKKGKKEIMDRRKIVYFDSK